MKQSKLEIRIFTVTLISSLFFLFLYLNAIYLKIDAVFIGIFQEIFTIPFLLLQPILLINLIFKLYKKKLKFTIIIGLSLFILATSMITIYHSFFN